MEKIKRLLDNPESYEWDFEIFVGSTSSYDLESEMMVLDPDGYDDPECPEPAKERGFSLFLSVAQVQDVVSNLENQCKRSDLDLRLKALRYYHVNDAFFVL